MAELELHAKRIVIDTSVFVAAARSRLGASFELIRRIPDPAFLPCLSIGLYLEWQQVLTRPENRPPSISADDVRAYLRYIASQCHLQEIHFLWRPMLRDPDDDMVLELAFSSNCRSIITHNTADFQNSQQLGIEALTPRDFLNRMPKR